VIEAADPVTIALTGRLPFILLLAAVLTWPVSLGLLRLYTRAVRRSMGSRARTIPPAAGHAAVQAQGTVSGPSSASRGAAAGAAATLYDLPPPSIGAEAEVLFTGLMSRPRRAALVYAVAGCAYGLVMAAAQLVSAGMEILPVRFLTLSWMFAWPVVLTAAIVATTSRRAKIALPVLYFAGLFALAALAMPASPDLTWGQIVLAWAMFDLPATVLLLAYLSRRVRAVGPLVLVFMTLSLAGSDAVVSVAGADDGLLRTIVEVASVVGLGAYGTFVALLGIGFVIFAGVGWLALSWIRRRYEAKQISDESITVDAVWLLFAVSHSIGLVFEHPLWALAGVAAFGVYKACVHVGFSWLGRRVGPGKAPALLVLRSFSIGRDSERLFDAIDKHWRRVGSIQMIAGVDLAWRTVEPHELLDFASGRLARRFIDGPQALDRRMSERDAGPDRDLRFRVNDYFCYDDTWKMVLLRLVHESDAVLMDLRGFSRQNAGCVFEIQELARLVPLGRVVFVVDGRTDERLLAEALGGSRAGVFRFGFTEGRKGKGLKALLRALAAAAAPAPTSTATA
jgi:hypothetical protein